MAPEKLLTADEVATILGVSRSKVYQMMRLREIPTIVLGKNVRVSEDDLKEYIFENREFKGEANE